MNTNEERADAIVERILAMMREGNPGHKALKREVAAMLPPAVNLEVLRLQPGDTLAINCPDGTTDEAREFARDISTVMPAGVGVLLVPPGWRLQRIPANNDARILP